MSGRVISKRECLKLAQTILKMWATFEYPIKKSLDDPTRLDEFLLDPYVLSLWIRNETTLILRNKKNEDWESELDSIIFWLKKQLGLSLYQKITVEAFDVELIKKELAIVSDWRAALEEVELCDNGELYNVSDIAHALDYGLSKDDLNELAAIHKEEAEDSKLRNVIQDLLESINYHTECSDFVSGNYSEYLDC